MSNTRSKAAPSPEKQLEALRSYGVEVRSEGSKWLVTNGNCVATLEAGPTGLRPSGQPGVLVGTEVGHLLDGGYQKFLKTPTRKVPATAEHLRAIHAFQDVLAAALGEPELYNTSLGTVSETYHYDRVKGRANP